jgi:hypothetical protein
MVCEPLKPTELVVKLRTGCRIPVRQVNAAHQEVPDLRLEISAVHVVRIAWKAAPCFYRIDAAG